MNLHVLASIALISPTVFVATAIASWFQSGIRPTVVKKMAVASTVLSIIIAAITGVLVMQNGLLETSFIGINSIGFSLRLDALSSIMFIMIA